jgi:hypothetical protein
MSKFESLNEDDVLLVGELFTAEADRIFWMFLLGLNADSVTLYLLICGEKTWCFVEIGDSIDLIELSSNS